MVSSLQVMILNSQLKDTLKNLWMGDIIQGSTVPLKLVNYKQEPFFIFRVVYTLVLYLLLGFMVYSFGMMFEPHIALIIPCTNKQHIS